MPSGEREAGATWLETKVSADIVIGASGVPVGDYTREALSQMPGVLPQHILNNVRSEEPE